MTSLIVQARAVWTRALAKSYFGSQVILATGTSLLSGALGLITGTLVARMLGPHGRGELAAVQAWPVFLLTISTLGLHEATIYFSARKHDQAARYLVSSVIMALAMAVPVMLIGYLLMPLLLAAQLPEIIMLGRWYLFLVPLVTLFSMPLGTLRGRADLVVWNAFRLAPAVGWLLVLLTASVLGTTSPAWVAAAYLIILGVLVIVVWSVVLSRVPGPFRPVRSDWWPMLRYGLPTMAGQTPQLLNQRFDQMLMAAFLAPTQLGWYVAAVAWSNALAPVLSGIASVIFPVIAAQTQTHQQMHTLGHGTRLGVVLSFGVGFILLLFAPIAIPGLFGADFTPAIPAAMVLVIAGIVYELNNILREGGRGLGATKIVLAADLTGFAAGLGVLVLLIGPLSILGAAIASLVGYLMTAVLLVIPISRVMQCSVKELLWPRREELRSIQQHALSFLRRKNHKQES